MSDDQFAVRVENVSKVYRLWGAPNDRLFFLIKRLLSSFKRASKKDLNDQSDGYHDFFALKDVSFEIRKGESWGFVGVNGSGKSTLLKIISGNLRLTSGRVVVDGKVAILDYGSGFNGDFTGKENIFLKATLLGLTKKQINERYDSIVEFAEIGDFINQPVKTYSSGMSARLGFAIMAHVDADIIITDEALAVGDVFFVQKCMRFIRKFLEKGTFLFVSHSTNDVLSLCQKAVWLEHGVIRAIGPASKVTQAYLDKTHLDSIKNLTIEENEDVRLAQFEEKIMSEVVLLQPALSKLLDYKLPKSLTNSQFGDINYSNLRNDVQVLPCEFKGSAGVGGAKISNIALCDEFGAALSWIIGGEKVALTIEIVAQRELKSPMIGFQLIDSLGQIIFADTSYLVTQGQPVLIKKGTVFSAEFTYQMPFLPVGDYTIRVAVAMGEDEGNAILLQTIDRALVLRSVTSYAKHGLIGIPMQSISIECEHDISIEGKAAYKTNESSKSTLAAHTN